MVSLDENTFKQMMDLENRVEHTNLSLEMNKLPNEVEQIGSQIRHLQERLRLIRHEIRRFKK